MRVARFGNPNVEGDDHAARRQIELYRQTKTSGRTRRGRIRASRRRQEGSRTARVGDGQQGNRRRQQERLGPRRDRAPQKRRPQPASETQRRGRERAKPRGTDSAQATSAALSAESAGATKSAPHCAFKSPTISALGRARLNRNPCPS